MKLKSSNEIAAEPNTVMVIGPPSAGKTVVAATFSEHCPDEVPSTALVDLPDLVYVQTEPGGSRSLRPLGLNIPTVIDISDVTLADDTGGVRALDQALDEVSVYFSDRQKTEPNLKLIIDSISSLDDVVSAYFRGKYPDGKETWNHIAGFHSRLRNRLRLLHAGFVLVCHTKVPMQMDDRDGKAAARRAAKGAAESVGGQESSVTIDITGKSGDSYNRFVDHIFPLTVKQIADAKGKRRSFMLHPKGTAHITGKSRYAQLLDDAEPAHLNRLFKKIATKLKDTP